MEASNGSPGGLPHLKDECFFIAPIGEEGSDARDRSDGVLEYIVAPAAAEIGLTTIRADQIAKPGQITRQVIEHVVGARAAVVDLTDANPNVYYEMAVRHTSQLPTVLIAQEGEKLPFDIAQMRTIFFDHKSLKSAAECKEQIAQHLREAMEGEVDSPIAASVSVQRLEQGSPQDRVLAQLVDGLDDVRRQVAGLRIERGPNRIPGTATNDLLRRFHELDLWQQGHPDDPELESIVSNMRRPVEFLGDRAAHVQNWRAHDLEISHRDEVAMREIERVAEAEREAERKAERKAERVAEREAERDT